MDFYIFLGLLSLSSAGKWINAVSLNDCNDFTISDFLTSFNFLLISHGCCFTWWRSSLCNLMFSKICSWVAPSPSIVIAVLQFKQINAWKCFSLLVFIRTYSPELVVNTEDLRRSLSYGEDVRRLPFTCFAKPHSMQLSCIFYFEFDILLTRLVLARLCSSAPTPTDINGNYLNAKDKRICVPKDAE